MTKHKFFLPLLILSTFLIGVIFGNKFINSHKKKSTTVTLSQDPKYLNQKITEQESQLINKILKPTIAKCINELDDYNKMLLNKVITTLPNKLVSTNIYSKYSSNVYKTEAMELDLVRDLQFREQDVRSYHKFKRCLFKAKKLLSKEESKLLKLAIKKTSMKDILVMFQTGK